MQLVAKAKIYQKSWVKARKERFYRANYDSPGSFDEVARETINQKKKLRHVLYSAYACPIDMYVYVCMFVCLYVCIVCLYIYVCV